MMQFLISPHSCPLLCKCKKIQDTTFRSLANSYSPPPPTPHQPVNFDHISVLKVFLLLCRSSKWREAWLWLYDTLTFHVFPLKSTQVFSRLFDFLLLLFTSKSLFLGSGSSSCSGLRQHAVRFFSRLSVGKYWEDSSWDFDICKCSHLSWTPFNSIGDLVTQSINAMSHWPRQLFTLGKGA